MIRKRVKKMNPNKHQKRLNTNQLTYSKQNR